MTRAEHLAWAKKRALVYVDAGDLPAAYSSLAVDLMKHSETDNHAALELGAMLLFSGKLNTSADMRDFIEGVN